MLLSDLFIKTAGSSKVIINGFSSNKTEVLFTGDMSELPGVLFSEEVRVQHLAIQDGEAALVIVIDTEITAAELAAAEADDKRVCSKCGAEMSKGFVIENGSHYYCNQTCMEADGMTYKEFLELYDNGDGDSYWTEWE